MVSQYLEELAPIFPQPPRVASRGTERPMGGRCILVPACGMTRIFWLKKDGPLQKKYWNGLKVGACIQLVFSIRDLWVLYPEKIWKNRMVHCVLPKKCLFGGGVSHFHTLPGKRLTASSTVTTIVCGLHLQYSGWNHSSCIHDKSRRCLKAYSDGWE